MPEQLLHFVICRCCTTMVSDAVGYEYGIRLFGSGSLGGLVVHQHLLPFDPSLSRDACQIRQLVDGMQLLPPPLLRSLSASPFPFLRSLSLSLLPCLFVSCLLACHSPGLPMPFIRSAIQPCLSASVYACLPPQPWSGLCQPPASHARRPKQSASGRAGDRHKLAAVQGLSRAMGWEGRRSTQGC